MNLIFYSDAQGEALCSGLWHCSCELSTAQGVSPEQSRNNFPARPGIKRPPKAERRDSGHRRGLSLPRRNWAGWWIYKAGQVPPSSMGPGLTV